MVFLFYSIMEIWKDIKDYEGIYQVSNYGRVKSFKYNREKILKSSNKLKRSFILIKLI